MSIYEHQSRDDPFNEAEAVQLDPGQQGTVTFTPEDRLSRFFLPMLAVSKYPNSEYEVERDGTNLYGPAPIPPTDIDDDSDTFVPPETFNESLTVTFKNLDGAETRTYVVQAKGWERRRYVDESGGGW